MSLREFINKYQAELNTREFGEVYSLVDRELSVEEVGMLTELLYKCGIDPLKYMTEIPNFYAYKSALEDIKIPRGVTTIGECAFYGCKLLTSVTIPDKVTNIGDLAFYYCTSLVNIEFLGTIVQWNAINKGVRIINDSVPTRVVHCLDGNINL